MDPLSILREFAIDNKLDQVVEDGTRIKFGEKYVFPKTSLTGYKRHTSQPETQSETYDLWTLVYFLKLGPESSADWFKYVRSARDGKISQVAFPDKKELKDYLLGKLEKSDKVQLTAPELLLPSAAEVEELGPDLKRARIDPGDGTGIGSEHPEAKVGPVIGRERQLRDRNDQMRVPGKSFSDVLPIIEISRNQQRQSKERAKAKAKAMPTPAKQQDKKGNLSVSRSRYDQPVEPQNSLGAFKLSQSGRVPAPPPPPPENPGAPPPPPPSSRPPSSHASQRESQKSSSKKRPRPSDGSVQPPAPVHPIIILPASASARITMLNVKDFLEEGSYKSNESMRAAGVKKEARGTFLRKVGRPKPVLYEVTDKNPTKKEWNRVVAVFVTGQAWQFKEWPNEAAAKGNMAELFHTVLGINVAMKNEIINDNLKSWNIKQYSLHPDNRHGDKSVVVDLFNCIDKFLSNKNRGTYLTY